jgi:nucleoside phosphorylase
VQGDAVAVVSEVRVGVVTALPWECAAARLFVDDLRGLSVLGDPNHYGSGWMPSKDPSRPHRVVVALQAQDGTRNAAALCSDMARSFPELQVFVMCGIAGGVPAAHGAESRVRLGDILSATAGVVDYDHVRSVDGRNVLRRSVEGLSKALLRADRELEVRSLAGDEVWRGPLDDVAERAPRFGPLSQGADPLELESAAGAGVRVVADDTDDADAADAQRARPGGWPRVHRGAIGSADRLVRDVVLRDLLAERYGILGVEMEGSGVAVGADLHDRHWFMVRGVADYCDDRTKSDAWHPYASLAAAAYVRALFAECQPFGAEVRRYGDGASDASGVSSASSASSASSVGDLQAIVQALLDLPVFRDDYQRRAVLAQLPERIRTAVPDNVVARLHVVALVRTCEDFPDGRDALLDVLRLTLGADSAPFVRVQGVILDNWSRG